jgi:hypothetical protein
MRQCLNLFFIKPLKNLTQAFRLEASNLTVFFSKPSTKMHHASDFDAPNGVKSHALLQGSGQPASSQFTR